MSHKNFGLYCIDSRRRGPGNRMEMYGPRGETGGDRNMEEQRKDDDGGSSIGKERKCQPAC